MADNWNLYFLRNLKVVLLSAFKLSSIYTSKTLLTVLEFCNRVNIIRMNQKQCLCNLEKFLLFQDETHE